MFLFSLYHQEGVANIAKQQIDEVYKTIFEADANGDQAISREEVTAALASCEVVAVESEGELYPIWCSPLTALCVGKDNQADTVPTASIMSDAALTTNILGRFHIMQGETKWVDVKDATAEVPDVFKIRDEDILILNSDGKLKTEEEVKADNSVVPGSRKDVNPLMEALRLMEVSAKEPSARIKKASTVKPSARHLDGIESRRLGAAAGAAADVNTNAAPAASPTPQMGSKVEPILLPVSTPSACAVCITVVI
jgi:hypothetical protein